MVAQSAALRVWLAVEGVTLGGSQAVLPQLEQPHGHGAVSVGMLLTLLYVPPEPGLIPWAGQEVPTAVLKELAMFPSIVAPPRLTSPFEARFPPVVCEFPAP